MLHQVAEQLVEHPVEDAAQLLGATLRAVLSSDISHWDVRNMHRVLPHAYELVEEGLLTADQFADFTFRNPYRLHTAVNPRFFDGTKLEGVTL